MRMRRGAIGLAMAATVVVIAAVGPLVQPHSSSVFVTLPFAKPSGQYPLGADVLGRDVFSRILGGGWVLLLIALGATAFGLAVGATAGITAGYVGGRSDGLIMRTVDVLLAFPQLVFALLLVSVIGPKVWLLMLAVGLSHAPQVSRVIRAATLDVAERDFVKAAELRGVPASLIMRREILPSLAAPLMVEAGLRLTLSIVLIAGLSFIGFGLQPPAPNWGYMINENRIGLISNPWAVVAPAMLVTILAIGINLFTDAVAHVALGVDRDSDRLASEHLELGLAVQLNV